MASKTNPTGFNLSDDEIKLLQEIDKISDEYIKKANLLKKDLIRTSKKNQKLFKKHA